MHDKGVDELEQHAASWSTGSFPHGLPLGKERYIMPETYVDHFSRQYRDNKGPHF